MELDFLETYIQPEILVLIPVLYIIGLLLRQTEQIPIWTHAWIKTIIAIVACFLIIGLHIDAFIQGILISGAAVLMKDLIHKTADQTTTKKEDNEL